MRAERIAVRWTIGDVSDQGYEALRLSVWGMHRLFGRSAKYAICLNTLALEQARSKAGALPAEVEWIQVNSLGLPLFLRDFLDDGMAEGVAWKFAPLRAFKDRFEIALDNDCILWGMPKAMYRWLDSAEEGQCLLAEDVRSCFGQFAGFCGTEPRNLGIRGLPPGFDLEDALRGMLDLRPARLESELDEQGLQVAALSRRSRPLVVTVSEVSICSPFPPHLPELGSCGAHFVGLNARELSWNLNGRGASEYTREHWRRHRKAIYERVGIPFPGEEHLLS